MVHSITSAQGYCGVCMSYFSRSSLMGNSAVHSHSWPWASSHIPGRELICLSVICPSSHPFVHLPIHSSVHPSACLSVHLAPSHPIIHPSSMNQVPMADQGPYQVLTGNTGSPHTTVIVLLGILPSGQLRGHTPGFSLTEASSGHVWGTLGLCPLNSHLSFLCPFLQLYLGLPLSFCFLFISSSLPLSVSFVSLEKVEKVNYFKPF